MEKLLKRKIDSFLVEWKKQSDRMPLIVRGARQIGKTKSILEFAKKNYKSIIEINFALHFMRSFVIFSIMDMMLTPS